MCQCLQTAIFRSRTCKTYHLNVCGINLKTMTQGNRFWNPCACHVPEAGGSVMAVTLKESKCDTPHQREMSQE